MKKPCFKKDDSLMDIGIYITPVWKTTVHLSKKTRNFLSLKVKKTANATWGRIDFIGWARTAKRARRIRGLKLNRLISPTPQRWKHLYFVYLIRK